MTGTTDSPVSVPMVSLAYARRHEVFIEKIDEQAIAYLTENTSTTALLECQRIGGLQVSIHSLTPSQFSERINRYFEAYGARAKDIAAEVSSDTSGPIADVVRSTQDLLSHSEESAPVVRLINAVLADAIRQHASDIHIETFGEYFAIRYRVDGILHDVAQPNRGLINALISRIKVMASMDIAEKRVPQDGSISVTLSHREVDVRVSTLPTRHGERVVLRLLSKEATDIGLHTMGLSAPQEATVLAALSKPQGLVLVTGPTGSGKSTTLYAGLRQLNSRTKNVLTVEDPIEYELDGIGQTQVNVKAGMTFAKTLRAILRQDPDVVMVGEIRDLETAQTAVQASLTGHLVLSTLHTNTAIGAVNRLIDMDIEPFLLSSTLELLMSQRLVRRLCSHCKLPKALTKTEQELLKQMGIIADQAWSATGCPACQNKGFLGRIGIFELIPVSETLRFQIHSRQSEQTMVSSLGPDYRSILHDGLVKATQGVTTFEEVIRVSNS